MLAHSQIRLLKLAIVTYLLEIQLACLVIGVSHAQLGRNLSKLDCSKHLEAFNLKLSPGQNTTSLFLEPVLHACIRSHKYNTQQLPLRVGEERHSLDMTYNFFFTNLLLFESDGTIGFKAFVRFEWKDENLVWDLEKMPLQKIRLHYLDVWTPLFLLANCETDLCYLIPHNRSMVGLENDGTVTFVVQIRQLATCVMNLKV